MKRRYRFQSGEHIEIKKYVLNRLDTIQPGEYQIVHRHYRFTSGEDEERGPAYDIAGPLPYRGMYFLTEPELLILLQEPTYRNSEAAQTQEERLREMLQIEELVNQVTKLYKNTPEGAIQDSDTVLADLMMDADFELTGISLELLETWMGSKDRASIEAVFLTFTGKEFKTYLELCIEETSRQTIK